MRHSKSVAVLGCVLVLGGVVRAQQSEDCWAPPPEDASGMCGMVLAATPQGVPARSNNNRPNESCAGRGSYGLQYQCVEFARRVYGCAYGIDTRANSWRGDAYTYCDTAEQRGLVAYPNGSATPPEAGDLLVYDRVPNKFPYGHVAVVQSVSATKVELIEQNWSRSGTVSVEIARDSTSGAWYVASRGQAEPRAPVRCWLRRPSPHPIEFGFSGTITRFDNTSGSVQYLDAFRGRLFLDPTAVAEHFLLGGCSEYRMRENGAGIELLIETQSGPLVFRSDTLAMQVEVCDLAAYDRLYFQSYASADFPAEYSGAFERLAVEVYEQEADMFSSGDLSQVVNLRLPRRGYAYVGYQSGSTIWTLEFNSAGDLESLQRAVAGE